MECSMERSTEWSGAARYLRHANNVSAPSPADAASTLGVPLAGNPAAEAITNMPLSGNPAAEAAAYIVMTHMFAEHQ